MSERGFKAMLTEFFLELKQSLVFLVHALSHKALAVLLIECFVN
jgi:hypothetical protein